MKRSRWTVLLLLTGAHALSAAAALAVAPLAPVLLDALGLTRVQIGLLVPAIYLGGVLMSMPAGWITDRLGVRATLAAGLLFEAVMIALAGEAPRFTVLLACLFGAGVGFSVVNPTTGKAIIERFPMRERGVAMGIKQTGLTSGACSRPSPCRRSRSAGAGNAPLSSRGLRPRALAAGLLSGRGPGSRAARQRRDPPRRFAPRVGRFLHNRFPSSSLLVSGFTMALTQSSVLASPLSTPATGSAAA